MNDPIEIATSLYLPNQTPTLEEALAVVGRCADAVARLFLSDRGYTFAKAGTFAEAGRLMKRVNAIPSPFQDDPVGYAAYSYQYDRLVRSPGLGPSPSAKFLNQIGDDCFYESSYDVPDKYDRQIFAMYCYQLAAGLDPESEQGPWNAMTVCWQGSFGSDASRFKAALPYAMVVAAINPQRDEVAQIMAKIGSAST